MKTTKPQILPTLAALLWLGFTAQAATLVCQWSFEGNLNDSSGNGNNGSIVSGSPSYVPGVFGGQGIYLNSRTDQIADTAGVNLPVAASASWSYNVWLYLTNAPDSLAYFCGFGSLNPSANATRGLINYSGGIYSWAGGNDLASGVAFPLNAWSMVTITHDGSSGTTTIWLNGTSIASGSQSYANAASEIHVGGAPWSGDGFQGIVDEFTIWSGILSATDIASLYASNSVPSLPSITTAPASTSGYEGEYLTLTVTASGAGPFTYQWFETGTGALLGATNNTLVLGPLNSSYNATSYSVVVSNPNGSVTSAPPATVTVLSVPNIATGLTAYWPFEEDTNDPSKVTDVTGNGNDGRDTTGMGPKLIL